MLFSLLCFLAVVSAVLLCRFCAFFALLPLSCVWIHFKQVFPRCSALSLVLILFFYPFYLQKSCVAVCMFPVLSLGFSCARSGLPLPFLSLCFFCVFLLGPKGPYLCPVCLPVNIATIAISCFAVSFFVHFACTACPNSRPQRPPVSLRSSFSWPTMP